MITGHITATVEMHIRDGLIDVTPWSGGSGHGAMHFNVEQARLFARKMMSLADELEQQEKQA